jgi:hypothetical protein
MTIEILGNSTSPSANRAWTSWEWKLSASLKALADAIAGRHLKRLVFGLSEREATLAFLDEAKLALVPTEARHRWSMRAARAPAIGNQGPKI